MIEIKLPKQFLAFTEREFVELLKGRPDMWAAALKRAKGIMRHEKEVARMAKINTERGCEE